MKIKKQKNNRKLIIISIIIIVLLAFLGIIYTLFIYPNHTINIPADSEKKSSSEQSESRSTETNKATGKPTESNTDIPAPKTQNELTGKQVVQMVAYVDISNNTVYIRGGINNASVSSGRCYAQLAGPNDESIEKETSLLQNATTTDCKTISINSETLSQGTWRITLYYTSDEMEGQSNETSITIK